jgi:hypothetical protein
MSSRKIRYLILSLVLLCTFTGVMPAPAKPENAVSSPQVETQVKLLRSDESGLWLELSSDGYTFEQVELDGNAYERLVLADASYTQQAGMPQLPLVSALIGVPAQAEIKLKVISDETAPLPGNHRLPPAPTALPPEGDFQPGGLAYLPDALVYASLEAYPPEAARLADDAWLRDQRIVRIELYPFQYIPGAGQVLWHSRLQVQVSFESGGAAPVAGGATPSTPISDIDTALDNLLLNADQAHQWRGLPDRSASIPPALNQPSVNSPVYRIAVQQDGLYRLSYETLAAAGLDVTHLDPVNLQLSAQGQDVAMYALNTDGDEHHFSPGEYLAFYGQKFYGDHLAGLYQAEDDRWLSFTTQDISGTYTTWTPHMNAAMLEKYTDENIYWLSLADSPGARMPLLNALPGGAPVPQTFMETTRAEQQVYWKTTLFNSEDTWYWDYINTSATTTRNYSLPLSAVASGDYQATLRGVISAESFLDGASPDHHTAFYLNDPSFLQPVLDSYWDGKSRYDFEVQLPQSKLTSGDNQLGLMVYPTPVLASQKLYFDHFEIEYQRLFQAQNNRIEFSYLPAGQWKYQVSGYTTNNLYVLDITQPLAPVWLTNWLKNFDVLSFQVNQENGQRYYAGTISDILLEQITAYNPPDLSQPAQYLVITHGDFIAPAQRLATYRQSQGLSTKVIDVQDLYNQFNYGIFNPLAIKNYLRYAFEQWTNPPEYVVLVGDGTWNFKGSPRYYDLPIYMSPNLSWVDPWNGEVDSTNLLASVVGDDILPDVFISRIPVNSSAELDAVVDKVIAYEATPRQDWQRDFVFVADNVPDPAGDFVKLSDDLIKEYQEPGYSVTRIYENDYSCPPNCVSVTHAITSTLNMTGTLLLNYIGHGAIDRWSGESILNNSDLAWLDNADHLPVALSMTCLDGYWIHPGIVPNNMLLQSLMEEALRASAKGTVASFSPSGFGVVTGHDYLHRGFYDALLRQGIWNLGRAAEIAKLNLFASGGNFDLIHTYTIFGDPALRLPSPYSLEMSPPTQYDSGAPGATITYYLQVANTSLLTDTLSFELSGNQWQTTIPTTVTLPAGESQSMPVSVFIPLDAADEQSDSVSVLVTSLGDRAQQAQSTITTTAFLYGVRLTPEPPNQLAAPGDVVTYTLTVYNNGAFEDTINLALQDTLWVTTLLGDPQVGPLQPGESAQRALHVEIPREAGEGVSDVAILIASSQGDPRRTAQVNLVTWAYHYSVQLYPLGTNQQAEQGELVTYLIRLDNTSRLADTFDIQVLGNQWLTTLEPSTVGLFPLNSTNLALQVQVPLKVPLGAFDTVQVMAISRGDPTLSATVEVTTRLSLYQLYMPEIER